ncbi:MULTISPECIES: outer membrane beta-barrel protein [unclassified Mesoflavibacter]|uniref:outer membrane beta-barrel protein n=1 Tax=unclassified Mesoflavibacter TaxID=2630131 RepID=UPI00300B13DB
MKKLLFAAAFAVLGFTANAQEEQTFGFAKGDLFISGSVTFSNESTGDVKDNAFEVAPKVGYFLSENIALGAKVGYTTSKIDNGTADANNNAFAVGVFGRYYFTPASKFSLFGELAADYMSYDNEYPTVVEGDGFGANLGAGLNYFVSSNFSIEAGVGVLGFNSTKADGADDATNTFSVGGDWTNVTFGVNYKF